MSNNQHENIIKVKLNDKQMRQNLDSAMHTLQINRGKLIKNSFKNWEELRQRGKNAKQKALNSLHERLVEFEENATKNGFIVHWAKDSKEACEIIHELMIKNNIDTILKGKSMASEEIGLNHYLEDKGLKPLETDLGEVIIQLLNEPPVHIVVPAIHKNRNEIGEIFHQKLGAPLETEPEKLNAIAREHMRKQFKTLKMGLGGVNFAMSKEGAIWMIENEGNGRMCTTIPDILVSICGIEKVVESIEDAMTADTLLTPSATGQFISNYNNIISGPRRDGELDGPKECHIVLLDNHRSDMLAHEDYHEALRCIRCGACMNFCPVYSKIGGHSYRAVYPGPIGEVISPQIFGMDNYGDIVSLCSLCGRCSEICPVKIPLADLIRKLRRDKIGDGINPPKGSENIKKSKAESMIFDGFTTVATSGAKWRLIMKGARIFSPVVTRGKFIPVVKNWLAYKDLPDFDFDLYDAVKNTQGVIYE